MERASWIVDGPWIARNVKNASDSSSLEIKDCEAYINCPNCSYRIKNNNVCQVLTPWPGLPKGVKFDPTDEEVIEHLEAKCRIDGLKPHLLIQDFICSVTEDVGINYTHPQYLPGMKKDGISVFFFNKTSQAYQKGQRKRRKITRTSLKDESVRWHKTGKTKPVMINGVQKGCKKILVLYKNTRKGSKPEKSNWVLHQYNLGTEEGEIGEFVVSKITYQKQKQGDKAADESECCRVLGGSRRSKFSTSTQPGPEVSDGEDEIAYDDSFFQELEMTPEAYFGSITSGKKAQVVQDLNVAEDSFLCKKAEACSSLAEKKRKYENFDIGSGSFSVSDLDNPDVETLPNFLSFASEDSLLIWLDGLKTPK